MDHIRNKVNENCEAEFLELFNELLDNVENYMWNEFIIQSDEFENTYRQTCSYSLYDYKFNYTQLEGDENIIYSEFKIDDETIFISSIFAEIARFNGFETKKPESKKFKEFIDKEFLDILNSESLEIEKEIVNVINIFFAILNSHGSKKAYMLINDELTLYDNT